MMPSISMSTCGRRVLLPTLVGLLLLPDLLTASRGRWVQAPSAPNEQIHEIGEQIRRRPGDKRRRVEMIVDAIFSERKGLGFTYRRRPTLTAIEAMEDRAGNCLTLVNLFVSLARESGLRAVYVKVDDFEVYYRQQGTIVRSNHVIAGAWIGLELMTVDFLPDRPKRYRQLREIPEVEAAALFYNAVASEALLDGEMERAKEVFDIALQVLPDYAETWNNYAIWQKRSSDLEGAEKSLLRALKSEPQLLSAIENLAALHRQRGELDQAEALEARALELKTQNPYFLLQQANVKLRSGEPEEAADMARKAQRIEPEIPDSYVVLGRVALLQGEPAKADQHFTEARKRSEEFSTLFQSRLQDKIQRLLEKNHSPQPD